MKTNLRKHTTRVKNPLSLLLTMIVTALAVDFHLALDAAPAPVSLSLKGSWPPHRSAPAVDIALQGQYAYVAADWGGLIILDVSDPTSLVPVGGVETGYPIDVGIPSDQVPTFTSVAVSETHAFVTGNHVPFQVIDIAEPRHPAPLEPSTEMGSGDNYDGGSLAVSGDYAYVAGGGVLHIVDISNPAKLVLTGSCDIASESGSRIAVSGNYAYVTGSTGLHVVNISDPPHPVLIGDYSGDFADLAASGTFVYLAGEDGLDILDLSDPHNPVRIGGIADSDLLSADMSFSTIAVSGDFVYVAYPGFETRANYDWIRGGFFVINVSDPSQPTVVGRYQPSAEEDDVTGPRGLVIASNFAWFADYYFDWYAADVGMGVCVVDLSNQANPVLLDNYRTHTYRQDAAVSGHLAYLANYGIVGHSVDVIDLENPSAPARVGSYRSQKFEDMPRFWVFNHVSVDGNQAYLFSGDPGAMEVLDVSDPVNPLRVGLLAVRGVDMARRDGCLVYAAGRSGLNIINACDPQAPFLVATYRGEVDCYGVALWNQYACLATDPDPYFPGEQEFEIVDVSDPYHPASMSVTHFSGRIVVRVRDDGYAYVAEDPTLDGTGRCTPGRFHVLDVRTPSTPVEVGMGLTNLVEVKDAVVSGDYIYLAAAWAEPWGEVEPGTCLLSSFKQGVLVVDVSSPAAPIQVGAYELSTQGDPRWPTVPYDIEMWGDRICFLNRSTGQLQILEQTAALRMTGFERQTDGSFEVRWTGGIAPYQVQTRSTFSQGDWQDFGAPTSENRVILQPDQPSGFVRVMSVGRP